MLKNTYKSIKQNIPKVIILGNYIPFIGIPIIALQMLIFKASPRGQVSKGALSPSLFVDCLFVGDRAATHTCPRVHYTCPRVYYII